MVGSKPVGVGMVVEGVPGGGNTQNGGLFSGNGIGASDS